MFGGKKEEGRPRLCPACGTLVGSTATRCHNCGASMTFSLAAASKSLSGVLPTETPATYLVLIANIVLFVYSLLLTMKVRPEGFNLLGNIDGMVLYRLGACYPTLFFTHEYWRLVMPNFLHGGLIHIVMNSFVLMDVGPKVEDVYGSARFFFLYLVTGISGFIVSAWMGHFSIGASASVCGLIGVMIGITYRRGGALNQMIRSFLIRWVIFIFIFGLMPGVDGAAHFGGLAAGFVLGRYVFDDREPVNAAERNRAYFLGWSALLLVVVSFALMARNFLAHAM